MIKQISMIAAIAIMALPNINAVTPSPGGGYPNGNSALGDGASFSLDTSQGTNNTALGFDSMYLTTTGDYNTVVGSFALLQNSIGGYNTAVGANSLYRLNDPDFQDSSSNTALGAFSLGQLASGEFNIAIGYNAGWNLASGNNNLYIGSVGPAINGGGEFGTIRIGTAGTHTAIYIAGALAPISGGQYLGILPDGQLGTIGPRRPAGMDELEQRIAKLEAKIAELEKK